MNPGPDVEATGDRAAVSPGDAVPSFSPSIGGPLHRLYLRTGLAAPDLERVRRRMVAVAAAAWLPLAVLVVWQGGAQGGVRFLGDFEVQLRFLLALPILVGGELFAHNRIRAGIGAFITRGLVKSSDRPRFDAAVAKAIRLRDSTAFEIFLLLLVFTLGQWVWRTQVALGSPTWYARPDESGLHLTPAGQWGALVSVPLFQFMLLRTYARLFIWYQLLWRLSRLDLQLTPTHPDRCGGLSFIATSVKGFGPLLLAQGVLLAGLIANRIFHEGHKLSDYKVDAVLLMVFALALVHLPLAVFAPMLDRTKRRGLGHYGSLASRYVQDFDRKWVQGGADNEPLLGTPDLQSLADLGNSYAVVRDMRLVPFSWKTASQLAVLSLAPLLPLALTAIPLEEVVDRFLKILF